MATELCITRSGEESITIHTLLLTLLALKLTLRASTDRESTGSWNTSRNLHHTKRKLLSTRKTLISSMLSTETLQERRSSQLSTNGILQESKTNGDQLLKLMNPLSPSILLVISTSTNTWNPSSLTIPSEHLSPRLAKLNLPHGRTILLSTTRITSKLKESDTLISSPTMILIFIMDFLKLTMTICNLNTIDFSMSFEREIYIIFKGLIKVNSLKQKSSIYVTFATCHAIPNNHHYTIIFFTIIHTHTNTSTFTFTKGFFFCWNRFKKTLFLS